MNFQPLNDMVLVLPDPVQTESNGVILPQGVLQAGDKAGDSSDCFIGTVVAIGPGDRHRPVGSFVCSTCGTKPDLRWPHGIYSCRCTVWYPAMQAAWNAGRHPMLIAVGDRVAFPRRPSMPGGEFSVKIEGVDYVMFHEEQFGFGVIEA